jgi:putative addiction module killer protein
MFEFRRSDTFKRWLASLRDQRAYERIVDRLARVQVGQFGDVKYFDGIAELRIDYGPGYRIYFAKREQTIIFLLCGGDKSTQSRDIKRAKELAQEA